MSDPVWSANCKQSLSVMLPVALIFKIYRYYAGIMLVLCSMVLSTHYASMVG